MKDTEIISSVGIDIGTTTTQLVFSRLVLKNTGGYGMAPEIEVVKKEVVCRSRIYFTPLLGNDEIDGAGVRDIIENEYRKAGLTSADIDSGAVIITGESMRKANAGKVCNEISGITGDFVVATAGPDLESVLAGKGAGCPEISLESENLGKVVCNLDIGGGTTNIACFRGGEVISTGCVDIGGRLVRIDKKGVITYISEKLQKLLELHDVNIHCGEILDIPAAEKICELMCSTLEAAARLAPDDGSAEFMKTNHLTEVVPDLFTFSGGVADCINGEFDDFRFGDLGVIFGRMLRKSRFFTEGKVLPAAETMRATVIGAGNCMMELSGSTIEYRNFSFPVKNIPVLHQQLTYASDIQGFSERIRHSLKSRGELTSEKRVAIAFKGIKNPEFGDIESIASEISAAADIVGSPLIVVVEEDMAKVLGQSLRRKLGRNASFVCIDGISCGDGDFIDIGEPVSDGKVVPAAVKTLIFK